MKKALVSLLTLASLVCLMSLTSCQKEENGNGTQFQATMEDCTSQNGKTVLSGTALNWQSGDRIAIYGTAGGGIYSATPQTPATIANFDNVSGETGNAPYRAFYPSTLTTDGATITLPATQTYVENSIHEFPMYAESSDNQLAFKNLCGVLKLHLTKESTNITAITVTASSEINGSFSVSYNSDAPEMTYSANGTNTITLTCTTAQSIADGKDFYIYLPEGSYSGLQIKIVTDNGYYCLKTANRAINVTRSQYTLIILGENDLAFISSLPQGALPGLFSVSATQQVHFSQVNLHYQSSTQTWRFADHQNGYVGLGSDIVEATYTGWIDHFGWGTGTNPTLATYNDYDYNTYVEWGSNAISNGGSQANPWRTLTSSEWDYIFYSRTNASSKYGSGCVNGVFGLIVLPDSWTLPEGCSFNIGMNGTNNNSYQLSEWAAMEAAGAIFLPAGGGRWPSSSTVEDIGTYGSYWSSTPNPTDECLARGFGFGPEHITVVSDDGSHRSCLFMVRLVINNY